MKALFTSYYCDCGIDVNPQVEFSTFFKEFEHVSRAISRRLTQKQLSDLRAFLIKGLTERNKDPNNYLFTELTLDLKINTVYYKMVSFCSNIKVSGTFTY